MNKTRKLFVLVELFAWAAASALRRAPSTGPWIRTS